MHKRLILDATKTFECRFSTGIQRVVRELVRHRGLIGARLDMQVVVTVATYRGYFRLDAPGMARLLEPAQASSGRVVAQSDLARRGKRLLASNMRVYAAMQRLSMRRQLTKLTRGLEPIAIGPEDVVVLIDDFSGGSPSLAALGLARRRGAATMAIVYDLIPLLHREMVPAPVAYLFKKAFGQLVQKVDGLIAISKSGADLMRDQPQVRAAGVPATSFYLGQDIPATKGPPELTTIPEEAWRGGPTFLMVGTIEPRKRHAATLAAFSKLWDQGDKANLLMVGRVGWEIDSFIEQAKAHPQYGKSLFLCHDVGDSELSAAMARGDAMIMASKAEGFGLPLVEALAFGVPVLASDIPIFREVAGIAGCYFPPDDIPAFADAIKQFIDHPDSYRPAARAFRWIDWTGSAIEFAAAVRTLLNAPRSKDNVA